MMGKTKIKKKIRCMDNIGDNLEYTKCVTKQCSAVLRHVLNGIDFIPKFRPDHCKNRHKYALSINEFPDCFEGD